MTLQSWEHRTSKLVIQPALREIGRSERIWLLYIMFSDKFTRLLVNIVSQKVFSI